MRDPWLSVIMPCYRGEEWVEASLDSLLSEADAGIEVVMVDGSPSSITRDLAMGYSDRLRIRVCERRDLESWQAKTNFGVSIAQSAHICWLGVDDLWLAGRAARVRQWIELAPDAPLHLAPSTIIDKNGRRLGVWTCPLPTGVELESALVTDRLLVQNFVGAPAPVFRRDAWLGCGGLDEGLWYTADWDIWLKLVAVGPVYYHEDLTVGFRIHKKSLTVTGSGDSKAFARQMEIVLERHLARCGDVSKETERIGRASIAVNSALAAASQKPISGSLRALAGVLGLGPSGMRRYFRDSRIIDRLVPRMRAKIMGTF